jgi:hypothetical protein
LKVEGLKVEGLKVEGLKVEGLKVVRDSEALASLRASAFPEGVG